MGTTATYNVGIDYGFLNNRINGSIGNIIEAYEDLLNTVSVAARGQLYQYDNSQRGIYEKRGLEFNINAVAIQTKDFSWELGLT